MAAESRQSKPRGFGLMTRIVFEWQRMLLVEHQALRRFECTKSACIDVTNVWMIVVAMNIPSTMPGRLPISGQRESWGVVG